MAEAKTNQVYNLSELRIEPGARKRGSWLAVLIVVFLVLLIGGAVAYYFFMQDKPPVVTEAVARMSNPSQGIVILTASGYVTPRQRATIASKISGRIVDILFEEGMFVEKDQLLATLDDADARNTCQTAEADLQVAQAAIPEYQINLADAERKLERVKSLFKEELISRQDLDTAQAAVDGLRARIAVAKKQIKASQARLNSAYQYLSDHKVKAPFAGIVVSKDAQTGEIVSPGSAGGGFTRTGIATIVDMASLEIEVDVNESYIARVTVGQKVEAVLDAYPDWKIPAKVRTVIPTADRQKATVKVRIIFDELDPRILPDMGVKVSFLNLELANNPEVPQVLIPEEAILNENGKQYVFTIKGDMVEKKAVGTGRRIGNDIEITAGVIEGEKVALGDLASLANGRRVRIGTNE